MEILEELFISEAPLRRILTYMCRSMTRDPITEAVHSMLTNPVQFHISRHGIGLFKGIAVFPYTYMTPEQRNWVYELVCAIRGEGNHTALSRLENPLEYFMENDRIFLRASNHTPRRLAPCKVFEALLSAMAETKNTTPDRLKLLIGLLLQRIGCRVNINRDTLHFITARSEVLFDKNPNTTELRPSQYGPPKRKNADQ